MSTEIDADLIELYRSLVMLDAGEGLTSSRRVAARFGKRHDNVMRVFDTVWEGLQSHPSKLRSEIFRETTYKDGRGQLHREVLMTRDGFFLLAMGFTGAAALHWKLRFIGAFNWLLAQHLVVEENHRLMAQFEAKNLQSIELGSFHGAGLAERKKSKRELASEERALRIKVQGALNFDAAPVKYLN